MSAGVDAEAKARASELVERAATGETVHVAAGGIG